MAVSILATDGGSKKGNLREQSVTDWYCVQTDQKTGINMLFSQTTAHTHTVTTFLSIHITKSFVTLKGHSTSKYCHATNNAIPSSLSEQQSHLN